MSSPAAADAAGFDYIVSDLDGTLLGGEHKVTVATRHVLKRIITEAKPSTTLVLATGRNYYDVKRICNHIITYVNFNQVVDTALPHVPTLPSSPSGVPLSPNELKYKDFYIIVSNGAVSKNAVTEELIYENCLDPAIAEALYNFLPDDEERVNTNAYQYDDWITRLNWTDMLAVHKESGLQYMVCPRGAPVAASDEAAAENRRNNLASDSVRSAKQVSPQPCIQDGNYKGISKIFFLAEPEDIAPLRQRILDHFGLDKISVTQSASDCLDVMAAGVNKGVALANLLSRVNPQGAAGTADAMARAIAFGDGQNDAELLSAVGKGCVMGNANPRLRAQLPHHEVIGRNDEDGVARKLAEVFGVPFDE